MGVRNLAGTNGRPVSGTQFHADFVAVCQWQETGGRCHTVPPDDHRPVMEGGVVFKNIDEKLTGHDGVDGDACSFQIAQRHFLLHKDQSACFCRAHFVRRLDDFVHGAGCGFFIPGIFAAGEVRKDLSFAQLFQSLPHFRLKDDEQCNDTHIDGVGKNKNDGM